MRHNSDANIRFVEIAKQSLVKPTRQLIHFTVDQQID